MTQFTFNHITWLTYIQYFAADVFLVITFIEKILNNFIQIFEKTDYYFFEKIMIVCYFIFILSLYLVSFLLVLMKKTLWNWYIIIISSLNSINLYVLSQYLLTHVYTNFSCAKDAWLYILTSIFLKRLSISECTVKILNWDDSCIKS